MHQRGTNMTYISTHALREEGDSTDRSRQVFTSTFLPTPSARRATALCGITARTSAISTHALREEGDRRAVGLGMVDVDFYPRPPRGGRQMGTPWAVERLIFLPTPSARRATCNNSYAVAPAPIFLPTPSARRATHLSDRDRRGRSISTHALREEGDIRP